ncbi:SpoIID/LytB domain-containing protein [Clostridium sp. 19966]|uniref:SpoIID/LytB domain-containing protein n=1 Tax=Clostridium sp. 19966 TaxID=2768166 RepID=UPI0028E047C1|nr:SpoIID/LytB domain-containing protein [Clostridium sp. 19966]MDT8716746.1 SpoIID/LytB domain-containing protein [Clostridium sp. 19966]
MKIKIINKRFYYILSAFFSLLLLILALVLLYPRTVENAVVIDTSSSYTSFFIGNKEKRFKTKDVQSLNKLSVVNFKYNLFKAYDFKTVDGKKERVMKKQSDSYDMELSGNQNLAKKTYYYYVDKNNKISVSDPSKLIIGKDNITSYKNQKGLLNIFIMTPVDYSTMMVAISDTDFKSVYHKTIEIEAKSPLKVYSKTENYSADIPEKTKISFEKNGSRINLTINGLSRIFSNRLYISGDGISVTSIKRADGNMIPTYNGSLDISNNSSGLELINEVPLEDYLTKVVPSEMPSKSPMEALKCQAIAARTYAISDMLSNRFADEGYYVDDSTKSQVYNNVYAQTSTTEAVNSTKSIIMTYNSTPIDAKYYSTSNGFGANFSDIWLGDSNTIANKYLKFGTYLTSSGNVPTSEDQWLSYYKDTSVAALDSSSQYFRWKVSYPSEALTKTLSKTLNKYYNNDDVRKYLVIKKKGKTIKNLPSLTKLNDIKVLKRGSAGNIITIGFLFDGDIEIDVSSDMYVRGSIKTSKQYSDTTIPIISVKNKIAINSDSLPSSFFSFEKNNDGYAFYGGGYGHGVGMSQYAAIEMGKNGLSYSNILNTFYKGIQFAQI